MIKYFDAPQENAVYRVQEDCCYTKVVYGGVELGVSPKIDQLEDDLNSWDLMCWSCDPLRHLIPTNEQFYQSKLDLVNALRSASPE